MDAFLDESMKSQDLIRFEGSRAVTGCVINKLPSDRDILRVYRNELYPADRSFRESST